MHRRKFLKKFSLLSTSVCAPSFLTKSIRAAMAANEVPFAANRILVVVELAGGCDGLNTVVPYLNDAYYSQRPNLSIPAGQVLRLDDEAGFHPAMQGFKSLFDEGKVALIQGVGYPNPNRSHFRSRDIWHTAEPDGLGRDNWLAKFPLQEYVTQTELDATLSPVQLLEGQDNYRSAIEYPATFFAQNLKTVAQMIAAEMEVSVFYARLSGFDTHAAQVQGTDSTLGQHAVLLETFSGAMRAFSDDLREMGRDEDVLIMSFSEFGRRLGENGRLGTDHGTANQMFIVGPSVSPGFYGSQPGLSEGELDPIGDMIFTVDFRSVYTTVLARWLGIDPALMPGGEFEKLPFI